MHSGDEVREAARREFGLLAAARTPNAVQPGPRGPERSRTTHGAKDSVQLRRSEEELRGVTAAGAVT
ncbi:hypothetical protein OHB56_35130 [Streptomyces sp. NBC_01635]|uniref:hypothetical protein n=1 Tax=Streptomyces sp. NBC_01635 TaxID=2975904 RepID=UPI00386BD4DB|nr:hypothetical protein OHB56_35130 [Streptomyces sp. NBC_01635]